jgi:hypothetical protein
MHRSPRRRAVRWRASTRMNFSLNRLATVTALLAVASCGAGTGSSPGSGTNTLRIDGSASASESVNGAETPAQFATEFTVRVSKGGAPVTGATVLVRSMCAGDVTLTDEMGDGTYRATQPSYCQTYSLEVTSGSDRVSGVTVVGPAIHRISAPTERQMVDPRQALVVRWSPSGAGAMKLESRDFSVQSAMDVGIGEVPMNRLRSEPGAAANERVRVTRSNSLRPAGAVEGSSFTVSVRNAVEFFTATN